MSAAARKQLRELLGRAPSTSEFLEDVLAALESGARDDDCPEGFRLLEESIEAFEEAEGDEDDDEGDDEDDEDDEEDEE